MVLTSCRAGHQELDKKGHLTQASGQSMDARDVAAIRNNCEAGLPVILIAGRS